MLPVIGIGLLVAFLWAKFDLNHSAIVAWIGAGVWSVIMLSIAIALSLAVTFLLVAVLGPT